MQRPTRDNSPLEQKSPGNKFIQAVRKQLSREAHQQGARRAHSGMDTRLASPHAAVGRPGRMQACSHLAPRA